MGNIDELRVNNARMRKNELLMSSICVTYLAVCGFILAANIAPLIMCVCLAYMIGAAVSAAIMAFGYFGVYCHNNTLAIGALVTAAVSIPLTGNLIYVIPAVVSVVLLVMTIRANTVYEELSRETGFPQFSELFEEQKRKSAEADRLKAEYLERQKKVTANSLDDLGTLSGCIEKKSDRSGESGYMDSI